MVQPDLPQAAKIPKLRAAAVHSVATNRLPRAINQHTRHRSRCRSALCKIVLQYHAVPAAPAPPPEDDDEEEELSSALVKCSMR